MTQSRSNQEPGASRHGHEPDVVNTAGVAWSVAGLAAALAAILLAMYLTFVLLARLMPPPPEPRPSQRRIDNYTGPRLSADEPRQLRQLRQAESTTLESYQWIDPAEGVVRIPIERAMDILSQERSKAERPLQEKHE